MQFLASLLAGLGVVWVPIVAVLFLVPIGILIQSYQFGVGDSIIAILLFVQAVSGFYIWIGYLKIAETGLYLGRNGHSFWAKSFFHHLLWIPLIPAAFGASSLIWWTGMVPLLASVWLVLNIVVSVVAFLITPLNAQSVRYEVLD